MAPCGPTRVCCLCLVQYKHSVSNLSPAALVAFVRTVELGSFAAAARSLDVSAPAIGQQVARLERWYSTRLLERSTRRMSLTPEGRVLFERARALVGELDQLGALFEEQGQTLRGQVRVSAPIGIARRHVTPIVQRFLALHPGVTVSLDASDAVRELGGESFDVALRVLPPVDSSVIAVRIARLEAVTVAAPSYLARRGTPKHPRDLSAHDVVVYRNPGSGRLAPLWFRLGGRTVASTLAGRFSLNDVDVACAAVELGMGIGQPPGPYVAEAIEAGRLVPLLVSHRATPWTLYLCHAGGRTLPRRVRAFVELAREELRRQRWTLNDG